MQRKNVFWLCSEMSGFATADWLLSAVSKHQGHWSTQEYNDISLFSGWYSVIENFSVDSLIFNLLKPRAVGISFGA
jgi:hypothetical protein